MSGKVTPITKAEKVTKPKSPETEKWFHGTRMDFTDFDASKAGMQTQGIEDEVIFFDKDKSAANFYTEKEDSDYNLRTGDKPRIIEAEISYNNPLIVKTGKDATNYYDRNRVDLVAKAEDNDHDVIIISSSDGSSIAVVLNTLIINQKKKESKETQKVSKMKEVKPSKDVTLHSP